MKISVFGLGYVGAVSAACLANDQHEVCGVDVDRHKVDCINEGHSPLAEVGLADLISCAVSASRLRAALDPIEAVLRTEISLICVGTPSSPNGNMDDTAIRRVCESIGTALKEKHGRHVVVVRSTVLPGTVHSSVIPILESHSGKRVGESISVCVNPEFLREGTALEDFKQPPFTVIGATDQWGERQVRMLYERIDSPVFTLPIKAAELLKYACNSFHAVKVSFANEIGNLCKSLEVDSHELMKVFCEDKKLNLSKAYLQPGFAFGGSCLPKDLRAINYLSRRLDIETPVLKAILQSNELQIQNGLNLVLQQGRKRFGILGLAFKPGTDDVRESPMVKLVENLLGKGMIVWIYDKDVHLERLTGVNRSHLLNEIPHVSRLMCTSIKDVVDQADVIVIGNKTPEFQDVPRRLRDGQVLIDLVRAIPNLSSEGAYTGISW